MTVLKHTCTIVHFLLFVINIEWIKNRDNYACTKKHKKTATFQVFENQLETLQKISNETGWSQADVLRQFIDRGVVGSLVQ